MNADERDVARFMTFVEQIRGGCWFWTGARSRGKGNRKWYGTFKVKGKAVRAHRFSCEVLAEKPCPPGHHRDHVCNFSMCVNPDHFEIVTHQENQRRKIHRIAAANALKS